MIGENLGPFHIVAHLGSGAMGTVYLAEGNGGRCAIKVLHPHLLERPGYFKRFQREMLVGQRVDDPNVVRILEGDMRMVGGEPRCYLVMEYVEGRTLRDLAEEMGRLADWLVRDVAVQVARALGAIHAQGIVHRDIKPANLIITPDETVKVMDLGLARAQDEFVVSTTGEFVGSVLYSAPEQIRGDGLPLDGRTDLFALGVVLYELSTGCHPFDDDDVYGVIERIRTVEPPRPCQIDSTVSPALDRIICKLMEKKRGRRFRSAAELEDALRAPEAAWPGPSRCPGAPPVRRLRVSRETGFHGRDGELERLRSQFARASEGTGRVVLIEGVAGAGKTRLVDELLAGLQRDSKIHALAGAYPPCGAATGLDAYTRAFLDKLSEEGLETGLERRLPDAAFLARAFGDLLRGGSGSEPLSPDSLHAGFTLLLRSFAAERPTVILVDDLQFAPGDGLALFAALAHAVPEHRVLLLGTTRRRLAESWQGELEHLDHVSAMRLDALGEDVVERIIAEALQSRRLGSRLGPLIAGRTEGNPLFVFEILRELREKGILQPTEDGGWSAVGRIDEIRVPASVRRLLEGRLAELDEEDRQMLEVAACCGFEFDPVLVAEALELKRIPLLRRLGRVERRHALVRSAGTRFAFEHHLIQETLHAGIAPALRQTYHALLADILEARPEEGDQADGARAAEVCEHHLLGGQPARARPHLHHALTHLGRAYHHERALEIIRRTLAAPELVVGADRVDLLLQAASRLDTMGQHDDMRERLDEALRLAGEIGDGSRQARVWTRLGALAYARGEYDDARAMPLVAVSLAEEAGDGEAETGARTQLGNCLAELGRLEEARSHFERCLAIAEAVDDRRAAAAAIGSLGQISAERGDVEDARHHLERSLRMFRELGDRIGEARVTGALGLVLKDLGRHEEAAELHRRHLAISCEVGYRKGESIALYNLGESLRALGRIEDAGRRFERSGRLAAEIGDRLGVVTSLASLGGIDGQVGRPDEARLGLEQALAMSREMGARWMEGWCLLGLGVVEEQVGNDDEADGRIEEAVSVFRAMGEASMLAEALVAQGRVRRRLGHDGDASSLLREALEIGGERGYPYPRVLGACHLARMGEHDVEEARRVYHEHVGHLEAQQRLEALVTLWQTDGRIEDLRASREILRKLEESVPVDRRDGMRAGGVPCREIRETRRRPADGTAGNDGG